MGWVGFRFALRAPVEREQVTERWEGLLPLLLVEFAPALSACGWGAREDRAESPLQAGTEGHSGSRGASKGEPGAGQRAGVQAGGVEDGMGVGQNGAVPGRGRNRAGRSGNRAGLKAGWGGAGTGETGV